MLNPANIPPTDFGVQDAAGAALGHRNAAKAQLSGSQRYSSHPLKVDSLVLGMNLISRRTPALAAVRREGVRVRMSLDALVAAARQVLASTDDRQRDSFHDHSGDIAGNGSRLPWWDFRHLARGSRWDGLFARTGPRQAISPAMDMLGVSRDDVSGL